MKSSVMRRRWPMWCVQLRPEPGALIVIRAGFLCPEGDVVTICARFCRGTPCDGRW